MKGAVLWGGAFHVCGGCGPGGPGVGRTGRAPPPGEGVCRGAAWGQMPGSRRTCAGCSAEQTECRSQARAVRRGESRRCGRHARRGGCGGCESGLGREPLAGRARFVRGPHALGARGVPTAPPVALCRAPCSALSHCLPAAALRSRGTSGLGGGRPVPRAPLPAPGCSVREGSAAPPRAKRSAKMAENDDLTTRWGRFRQTEGRGELCDTRCESRDLGFCSPAFLTSARPCRQVVIFGHFSTRDYVRARRRARCGGRAARERRGAWRSAGAAEPPRSSLRGAAGGTGCSCPSHRRRSTWRNSKMILPVSGGKILRGSRQRPVEKA